jgi:hypothetical protein
MLCIRDAGIIRVVPGRHIAVPRVSAALHVGAEGARYGSLSTLRFPTCKGSLPQQLLGQLRDTVAIVAAPAEEQLVWCLGSRFPVDEIPQSLGDMVPGWFERLREHNLLSPEAEGQLLDLTSYFDHMHALKKRELWQDEGLALPEWEVARERARRILSVPDEVAGDSS